MAKAKRKPASTPAIFSGPAPDTPAKLREEAVAFLEVVNSPRGGAELGPWQVGAVWDRWHKAAVTIGGGTAPVLPDWLHTGTWLDAGYRLVADGRFQPMPEYRLERLLELGETYRIWAIEHEHARFLEQRQTNSWRAFRSPAECDAAHAFWVDEATRQVAAGASVRSAARNIAKMSAQRGIVRADGEPFGSGAIRNYIGPRLAK